MQINTKFNTGDSVFFMLNNKIRQAEITSINIVVKENTTITKYKVEFENVNKYTYKPTSSKNLFEKDIFTTQEELLESLKV